MKIAALVLLAFGVLQRCIQHKCAALHVHTGNASSLIFHPHHLVRQDEHAIDKQRPAIGSVTASVAPRRKIPRLLHYIYLKGLTAFVEASQVPNATFSKEFFETCQTAHGHWNSLFWDEGAAKKLLTEHYPWFVPTWEEYDLEAKRSDALRVFIMHHFGGMYLDLDVECYRPVDASFKDYDVVLQGTGDEGMNNAVMASVPGHPFWQAYAKNLVERSKQGQDATTRAPMWMTGTLALSKSLFEFIKSPKRPVSGYLGGEFLVGGSTIKIFPIGEWYVPCYGVDLICQKQYEQEKESGEWDMTNIYGRHYFAESTEPKALAERLRPHSVERQ